MPHVTTRHFALRQRSCRLSARDDLWNLKAWQEKRRLCLPARSGGCSSGECMATHLRVEILRLLYQRVDLLAALEHLLGEFTIIDCYELGEFIVWSRRVDRHLLNRVLEDGAHVDDLLLHRVRERRLAEL